MDGKSKDQTESVKGERLAQLESLRLTGLLDTPPEEVFDRFTTLANKIVGAPVVLLSLVDEKRQFFKSQIGLPEPWATQRETPLSHSFCQHVIGTSEPLIIDDARQHPLVKDNLAIEELGVIAYAGIPLVMPDGQTIGAFCAIDTHPRHWSEREIEVLTALAHAATTEINLRMAAAQLKESYVALQEMQTKRDDMVHMLVHDIRTPLSSLVGGLQVLETIMTPTATEKQMLEIALRGARSLSQMVNDILDISRNETAGLSIECQKIEPAHLIARAVEQVTQLSAQKGIKITTATPPDCPLIFADEENIVRVFVNLLGNAIQHTPQSGQIAISASVPDEGKVVQFRVEDTGAGIPADQFNRIFEKFGQVSSRKTASSSGLGLTFCKMSIEQHSGRIWLESEVGVGTTFFFTIPLYLPDEL